MNTLLEQINFENAIPGVTGENTFRLRLVCATGSISAGRESIFTLKMLSRNLRRLFYTNCGARWRQRLHGGRSCAFPGRTATAFAEERNRLRSIRNVSASTLEPTL